MELRPEYQEILELVTNSPLRWTGGGLYRAVQLCQELADRPRVSLTDDEIDVLWNDTAWAARYSFVRHIMLAYDAKQKEPIEVPFDYEPWSKGSWQASELSECGKYWVTVNLIRPGFKYTMRKG